MPQPGSGCPDVDHRLAEPEVDEDEIRADVYAIPVRSFQNVFFRLKMISSCWQAERLGLSRDGASQDRRMGSRSDSARTSQGGRRCLAAALGSDCHLGPYDCVQLCGS